MGHHHLHSSTSAADGGVSQRVNSPRFSGAMTRRAHSFKRNPFSSTAAAAAEDGAGGGLFSTQYEVDLQMNSPRSEIGGEGFESAAERKGGGGGGVTQRAKVRGFLRKPIEAVVVEMGLRERKRLGHWMFFVFCGVCLLLGIVKICAAGLFGSDAQSNLVGLVFSLIHYCIKVSIFSCIGDWNGVDDAAFD